MIHLLFLSARIMLALIKLSVWAVLVMATVAAWIATNLATLVLRGYRGYMQSRGPLTKPSKAEAPIFNEISAVRYDK